VLLLRHQSGYGVVASQEATTPKALRCCWGWPAVTSGGSQVSSISFRGPRRSPRAQARLREFSASCRLVGVAAAKIEASIDRSVPAFQP
jgi:hypothetical protein